MSYAIGPSIFMLKIIHYGTGAITFATGPTGFVWPDGTVPTFSTTSGASCWIYRAAVCNRPCCWWRGWWWWNNSTNHNPSIL